MKPPQVRTESFTACNWHIYWNGSVQSWISLFLANSSTSSSLLCAFCPSVRGFASSFLHSSSSRMMAWIWLTVPTVKPVRDFHPIEFCPCWAHKNMPAASRAPKARKAALIRTITACRHIILVRLSSIEAANGLGLHELCYEIIFDVADSHLTGHLRSFRTCPHTQIAQKVLIKLPKKC